MFGDGFFKRVAKRLEEEKVLVKVTGARPRGNPPPNCQPKHNDLIEKCAPARYSSRYPQHHQPYA